MTKKAQGNKAKQAELDEAFEILSDQEKREGYDKHGEDFLKGGEEEEGLEGQEGQEGEEPDIQNIFDMLRGQKAKKPAKPQRRKIKPMQFALEATLDEIYAGATTKMRVTRMRICKACGGYFYRDDYIA